MIDARGGWKRQALSTQSNPSLALVGLDSGDASAGLVRRQAGDEWAQFFGCDLLSRDEATRYWPSSEFTGSRSKFMLALPPALA